MEYVLDLGKTAYGENGASLSIFAQRPHARLATPKTLWVNRDSMVIVARDSEDYLQSYAEDAPDIEPCITTAQGTVTIVTVNDHKYRILLEDKFGAEVKIVTVENPEASGGGADFNKLYITEKKGTAPIAVYLYEFTETESYQSWTLQEGVDTNNIVRTTTKQEQSSPYSTTEIERTMVWEGDGSGTPISDVQETFELFPFGRRTTEEIVDPGQGHLTSTWTYYTSGSNYGWMKKHTTPSGFWEYFEYSHPLGDGPNYTKKTVSQLGNTPCPASLSQSVEDANVVTLMHTYIDLPVGGRTANLVRKTVIKEAGTWKESRYYVRWAPQDGFYDKWDIVCASQDDGSDRAAAQALLSNPGASLVTKTRLYDSTQGTLASKTKWVLAPTGMFTLYTYSTPSGGTQTTWQDYGTPNSLETLTAVQDGERTITVVNEAGGEVSKEVRRIAGGSLASTSMSHSSTPSSQFDSLGRPMQVAYTFGTGTQAAYTISQQYGCCGLETSTDRAGRTITYGYDGLRRLTSKTDGATGIITSQVFDASGRVLTTSRGPSGALTLIGQNNYDVAGRLAWQMDEHGQYTFYRYRQVADPAHTGCMLNETRVYPNDPSCGPVQVTWANGQGTVRSWTASTTATWTTPDAQNPNAGPTGTEALTELTRTEMTLDYAGRVLTTRRYYDLGNGYYYQSINSYDALGQLVLQTDEMDNVTETVYTRGRPTERKQGIAGGTRFTVSKTSYDANRGQGTESMRDYPTRMYRVRPINPLAGNDTDFSFTDFDYTYGTDSREVRTTPPAPAPQVRETYDYQGYLTERTQYTNNGATLLARAVYLYDPTTGYLTTVQQYAGGGTDHLDTAYVYDAVGRRVITRNPEGGFTWMQYDDYGRVVRTTQAAAGGDTVDPSDDLVVSETAYTYEDSPVGSTRVSLTTTYDRLDDAPSSVLGLLSAAGNAGNARVTSKCSWYDDLGRVKWQADYGTDVKTARPSGEPALNTTTANVAKYEYDSLGRWREVTDNAGRVTRNEYDTFGRMTKLVEDAGTGHLARTTTYQYNAAGSVTQQTASRDGTGSDTTTYTYGGTGSPVPSKSQLMSISYPQGSTGTNTVAMTYNADGSLLSRTDQRGVILTFSYNNAGQRLSQTVSGTSVGGDKAVTYTYTALGQPDTIATTGSDGTTINSVIDYGYNGYGQLTSESLDLDGDGALAAKTIGYGYTSGTFSRLESVTYPHASGSGRIISYGYGGDQAAIAGAFSRVSQISDSSGTLANYAYTGMSQPALRWQTSPNVSMTYGYDSLGRVTQVRHFTGAPTETTLGGSTYGYDPAGNRVYDQPLVMPEHGQFYDYDSLNRLTKATRGVLDNPSAPAGPAAAPYASPRTVDPAYDLLGNFLEDKVNGHMETRTHNGVNEITGRSVAVSAVDPGAPTYLFEQFGGSSPLDNWDALAGTFSVGSGTAASNSLADDAGVPWSPQKKALMLAKNLSNLTDIAITASVTFPNREMYAGLVFGYQDPSNYWVCQLRWPTSGSTKVAIYQVTGGTWTPRYGPYGCSVNLSANTPATLGVMVQGQGIAISLNGQSVASYSATGVEPGRVGVLAGQTGVVFDDVRVCRMDWPSPASPTWQVHRGTFGLVSGTPSSATLDPVAGDWQNLAVREGTWGKDCDIEAQIAGLGAGIAFHVKDKLNYHFLVQLPDPVNGYDLSVLRVVNGQVQYVTMGSHYCLSPIYPQDFRHLHIKTNGADLGVWVELDGGWQCLVNPLYEDEGKGVLTGSTGGQVGLTSRLNSQASCNLLRVGSTVSHTIDAAVATVNETFATSAAPQYDAAGNMVNDGVYKYSYDAWNHLVGVQRQGPTAGPQVVAEYRYDGLGHRIQKVVSNSGDDMNGTEYFYYNAKWQLLEIATAGNQARQQFVWGTRYIDEAICMDVDTDGDGICTGTGSRHFFHMQDANWNVVGLREGTTIVERYEYDPYGTVRIYRGSASAGAPEQRTVAGQSLKWLDPSLPGNPVLYAGYFQDSETGLYYVRNRVYVSQLGTWIQTDPWKFTFWATKPGTEARNLYEYVDSEPVRGVDPWGLDRYVADDLLHHGICVDIWQPTAKEVCCTGEKSPRRCWAVAGRTCFDFSTLKECAWVVINFLPSFVCGAGSVVESSPMGRTLAGPTYSSCKADRSLLNELRRQTGDPPLYRCIGYNCNDWTVEYFRHGMENGRRSNCPCDTCD